MDYVHLRSGLTPLGTASNTPVTELHQADAKLHVRAPASEPAYVQELTERVSTLELEIPDLKKRLSALEQRQHKLAIQCLLDKSRAILAGDDLTEEQQATWNNHINTMSLPTDVTRRAAKLTRYGEHQQHGNAAAHDFTILDMADAVVCMPPVQAALFRELFQMCFNQSADSVLLDNLPSDTDE